MKFWFMVLTAVCFAGCAAGEEETPQAETVVVFDFGGVMADFDLRQMIQYCAEAFEVPLEPFKQELKTNVDSLAIGAIDEKAFWERLAESRGVAVPTEWKGRFQGLIAELVRPRVEMYALVDELSSSGYRVALLSDVTEWQAETFSALELYAPFDPVLVSCEIGARKPHREAYERLFDALGVAPEQCIFVDDRPENVAAANALGIRGIVYTQFEEVEALILEELGITVSR